MNSKVTINVVLGRIFKIKKTKLILDTENLRRAISKFASTSKSYLEKSPISMAALLYLENKNKIN
jgi:hypothetical protein